MNVRKRNAFTLIELLIAVLIIGILSAAAYPSFSAALDRMKVDSFARQLADDFRYTQALAVQTGIQHRITFSLTDQAYSVRRLEGSTWVLCQHPLTKKDWRYVTTGDSRFGGGCISGYTFGGFAWIVYDKFGSPSTGGSVTLRVGRFYRIVRIAPLTGRVTVEYQ